MANPAFFFGPATAAATPTGAPIFVPFYGAPTFAFPALQQQQQQQQQQQHPRFTSRPGDSVPLDTSRVRFANPDDSRKFECVICLSILDDPASCGNPQGCAALFCFNCIETSLTSTSKNCPNCNFTVPGRSIKNLLMKNQLLDSVVFCSSRGEIPDPVPEGVCVWNGKFSTLGAHLKECPCVEVKCANVGCATVFRRSERFAHIAECLFLPVNCELCAHTVLRKDMTQHLEQSCPCYVTTCECGAALERRNVEEHLVSVCPEALVPCLYAEYGCTDKVPRKQLNAHLSETEKHNTQLFMLRELSALRRDVAALRENIKVMELERATIMAPNEVSWTIQSILEKITRTSFPQNIVSPSFSVPSVSGGISKLCIQVRINVGSIGLYLQHAFDGQNTNVDISHWTFSVSLNPLQRKTFNLGTILAPAKSLGFGEFIAIADIPRIQENSLIIGLFIWKDVIVEPTKKLILQSR